MLRRLLAAILAVALGAAQAAEWVVAGLVVGISDGDTTTLQDNAKSQHKIRFAGIDAPEKGQATCVGIPRCLRDPQHNAWSVASRFVA
jgi:endonuclease YncB( thermonuclease family)